VCTEVLLLLHGLHISSSEMINGYFVKLDTQGVVALHGKFELNIIFTIRLSVEFTHYFL
jgi:hypothetical protein